MVDDNSPTEWQPRLHEFVADEWQNQSDGSHDLAHLIRVWRNCQLISRDEPDANRLVLLAASYLHDLVNLPKSHAERHLASRYSAQKASSLLQSAAFPPHLIDPVSHAIEAHSFSARITPSTLEAKILQDADRLEAIGALGIARCFYVAGQMSSDLFHAEDPFADERNLNDRQYAIDHFKVKLFPIVETMNTDSARAIARQRAEVMTSFLDALRDEISMDN